MQNAIKLVEAVKLLRSYANQQMKFIEEEDDHFRSELDYTDYEQFNQMLDDIEKEVKDGSTKG